MKKRNSSPNFIPIENYATKFEIGQTIRKDKKQNKAYRILFIKVSGKIICKNKRRLSSDEYKQRLALLALYSRRVIDLSAMLPKNEQKTDYHYLYEEEAWSSCLPAGKQKIVAISGIAIAIRPFITKWRVGFSPVFSLYGKEWKSLKLGVYPSYDEAAKALARNFPNFGYWDEDILKYAKEYKEAYNKQKIHKENIKKEIFKNISEIKKSKVV